MKALKNVNRAFDLDCLSNKKQATIKVFVFNLCNYFNKKKDKKKKRTRCFLTLQSL